MAVFKAKPGSDYQLKAALKKESNEVIPEEFLFQVIQQPETPVSWLAKGLKFPRSLK